MMLKDLALALSLSNLCFIRAWRLLLIPSPFFIYHQKVPPPPVDYVTLILDVLLLAGLFFIGIKLVRRFGNESVRKCSRVVFILIVSMTLHGLLTQIDNPTVHQLMLPLVGDEVVVRRVLFSIPLTISLFVLFIALFRINKSVRVAVTVILIFAPLVPLTFSQTVLTAMNNRQAAAGATSTPFAREGSRARPRVLWLVFDELDFRTAFLARPSTVRLPELDRLAGQSLFAENAYPPAGETFLTMPALITGNLISEAHRSGADELLIKFGDDAEAVPWSKQPNIFSRAREAGFNTALVGWYHPYCRIMGSSLTRCAGESGLLVSFGASGVGSHMSVHARNAALAAPLAAFVFPRARNGELLRRMHASNFNSIYRQGLEAATDPELDVVMVHWPIPHNPNIYNRFEDRISTAAGQSYLDNLALVDRTVGDIRRAMETDGTWDDTVVLLTSDHWWRADSLWKKRLTLTAEDESAFAGKEDRRVPFVLKMAGAGEGTKFTAPFNTILSHDLLLAILGGEVSDAKGAAAWIDRHRSIGRSPYDERSSRDAH